MKAAGSRDDRYVSRRAAEKLFAAARVDFYRRVRRMSREISPTLAMRSRAEVRWIYGAEVNRLYEEFSQVWGRRIESLPTRMALVRPSDAQRRDPDGSGGGHRHQ